MVWNSTGLGAFRSGATTHGEPDPDFPSNMRRERSVTFAQIAPKAKDRFFFDCDFGDGWCRNEPACPAGPSSNFERS